MAAAMGFIDRLKQVFRPDLRMLDELAVLAGKNEELAARLTRHAAACDYSNIKAGVEALAEQEAAHARALSRILQERGRWPRLPEPRREGSSNWERLSSDLEVLAELDAGLHRAAAEWEGIDPELSDHLLKVALEDDDNEGALRKLALLCDPQALN
jgi:rubrerythrin